MAAPVRVAVVNDYEIVVAGIATVLAPFGERIDVVELDSGLPVAQTDVDVVLYDSFGQPQGADLDPAAILGDIKARLVVFSWNTDPHLIARSLAAGATAYVSKGVSGAELAEAIEAVHAGHQVTPLTQRMPEGADFGRWPGADHGLAPREAEVLALICQGLSNNEIAQRAFLGLNTIKTYIRSLYQKIGVDSRTKAVLWGIDHGFRPDRTRHQSQQ